ncbi:MAG: diguanylate cyclase [Granulosicoccaceae bacterium]|jgi:diguanylate cyclase (GGDEF)-like protein
MPDENTAGQPHLLVVDDSRLMRRAIIKILGKEYTITEAADGEEGWTMLQQHDDIRVVFSDLSMPELDGFGLLERVRNSDDARIRETPVIIITGAEDDEKTKDRALGAGASDFISKPFESVELRSRAKTHVKLDTTSRKLTETAEVLEQTSTLDALTGLANKKHFDERLNKDIAFARRHRGELALLRIDIDNFNSLFTKHGKEPATYVLKQICEIIKQCVRQEDTLARTGVAKLAFLMPRTNRIGAKQVGERLRRQLAETQFEYGGFALPITVSIGVANPDITSTTTADDIIGVADQRLAAAVNAGGNCVISEDREPVVAGETEQAGEFVAITEEAGTELPPPEPAPDIETALLRIEHDEQHSLHPHLALLVLRSLPLLELANRHLGLDIDDAIARIRAQCGNARQSASRPGD